MLSAPSHHHALSHQYQQQNQNLPTATPSLRRTTAPRTNFDTPTPAPSSGHTSVLITSLKPARSRSNLSNDYQDYQQQPYQAPPTSAAAIAMAARTKQQHHQPFSVSHATLNATRAAGGPLGSIGQARQYSPHQAHKPSASSSLHPSKSVDHHLDHLEIASDGTERQRLALEEEIRRGMGELNHQLNNNNKPVNSPRRASPFSAGSIGFGGLSDVEGGGGRSTFRARMEDPSDSSSNGGRGGGHESNTSGSESLGEDFSLRLGQTAAAARSSRPGLVGATAPPLDEDDDEGESDRDLTYLTLERTVMSPPQAIRSPVQQGHARAGALAREMARLSPPSPAAATTAPPRRAFDDLHNFPASPAIRSTSVPLHKRAPPPPSSYHSSPAATRMRLPDVTGLTEGLQSPVRTRGHQIIPEAAKSAEDQAISGALGQLGDRLQSLERENAASAARVKELEAKLRDDELNAAVRAAQQQQQVQQQEQVHRARSPAGQEARDRIEWEERLREEENKREALEALVSRLRSHVTHLTHSLQDHSATLAALREAPPAPATSAPTSRPIPDLDLAHDVAILREGLDGLGVEVDAVKNVVNDLVREREVNKRWEAEEAERKADLKRLEELKEQHHHQRAVPEPMAAGMSRRREKEQRARSVVEEDPDRTPRAVPRSGWKWTGPDTPESGRSFLEADEVNRLREDLLRQEKNQSPTPRARRIKAVYADKVERREPHFEVPKRAATAPLVRPAPAPTAQRPRHHHVYAASDSSIASAVYRRHPEPAASRAARPAPPTTKNAVDDDMRVQFERAEEIFRSVAAPKASNGVVCSVCQKKTGGGRVPQSAPAKMQAAFEVEPEPDYDAEDESVDYEPDQPAPQPRQRVDHKVALESVFTDIKADFELHMRLYNELSEEYRAMDAMVEKAKRQTLAAHLKDSIDTLELKADQVKRLHNFLHFNAWPLPFGHGRVREGIV